MKNKNKFSALVLLMIPVGVAINVVAFNLINPILPWVVGDSIGTILVGAICGPVPGMLVGILSNIANIIKMPMMALYAVNSILFGLIAGLLSKKYWSKSLPKMALSSVIYAVIGGGIGSLITYILMGGELAGNLANTIIGTPMVLAGCPKLLAAEVGGILFDFIDKIVVVIIVYLVIRALPDRFLIKLPMADFVTSAKADSDED